MADPKADDKAAPSVSNPSPTQGAADTGDGTRDYDLLDAGVPMIEGDPSEPVGPEDAFGLGPKRGDYTGRIDAGPHLVTELIPDAEEGQPTSRLVEAGKRAQDQGDEAGKKGGVETG